ncbi:hypothetical protein FACS1894190_08250 [Spirochaetia bacterium]|nr:hypothetical protein FACS1894190_08250 [Spirochaetia bacterium]
MKYKEEKATVNYCIKSGYTPNLLPKRSINNAFGAEYQPDVYGMALFIAEKSISKYIINFCKGGDENPLRLQTSGFKIITVDVDKPFPSIDEHTVDNSVVICAGLLERVVEPDALITFLANLSYGCNALLMATVDRERFRSTTESGPPANLSHVREWTFEEFDNLLASYRFHNYMLGYTLGENIYFKKDCIVAISGRLVYEKPTSQHQYPLKRVLAVIHCYNEQDIIGATLDFLLGQGVDIYVVDNWSTDESYTIVKKYAETYGGRITLERFPAEPSKYYEWEKQLKRTEEIARESDHDWIFHYDADEIRESPWLGVSLQEAVSFVDGRGYNSIDFTELDFRPTVKGEYEAGDALTGPLDRFEFGRRPECFNQTKLWKNIKGTAIDLAWSGGHCIQFEGKKVFPLKFIYRHYAIRSEAHGRKKVLRERKARFNQSERKEKGWHVQYDIFDDSTTFLWDADSLLTYDPVTIRREYLVELLTGINIIRSSSLENTCCGKIYFDTGSGFSEYEILQLLFNRRTNTLLQEIVLPEGTRAIRFDPVENAGCVLHNLEIISERGHEPFEILNGFIDDDGTILFADPDPQIFINISGGLSRLKLQYNIEIFSEAVSFHLVEVYKENLAVIDELKRNISDKDIVLTETNAALAGVEKAYNSIINSKTWKLTKPLRKVLDVAKSVLRRVSLLS